LTLPFASFISTVSGLYVREELFAKSFIIN